MAKPQLKTIGLTAVCTARTVSKQGFGILFKFRQFVIKGNVLEIAVGLIIANAITAILESFVKDIFTPILSLIGGKDSLTFSEKHWVMYSPSGKKDYNTREEAVNDKAITLDYGPFLQEILQFIIAAVALFLLIHVVQPLFQEKEEPKVPCPYCRELISSLAIKCKACTSSLTSSDLPSSSSSSSSSSFPMYPPSSSPSSPHDSMDHTSPFELHSGPTRL